MSMGVFLLVAGILAGECGPLGPECELAVARTMANRLEDSRWSGGLEEVSSAYYGRAVPTDTSLVFAYVLVSRPEVLADGEFFFIFSEEDRLRFGWGPGEEILERGSLKLHLSRDWRGG